MSRVLSLAEIKELELQMLSVFSEFCEAHNLTYYLCGGTLLGAIRHKGFIPWDDDIDVCMPRADYDKFIELYSQLDNSIYEVRSNQLHNFSGPFKRLWTLEPMLLAYIVIVIGQNIYGLIYSL